MPSSKLLILGCLAASALADDCANYRKISAGECAEACVPSMVGLCPQSLIVKTGGLDAGHCADVNFTVADGTVDQKCGPCGTITFNKFKQSSIAAVNLDPPTGTFCGSLIGIIKENMTVRADNTFDYFNDVSRNAKKVHELFNYEDPSFLGVACPTASFIKALGSPVPEKPL